VRWQQHQAYGSNLYRLDGDALVVEHTIHVTALSDVAPIVYQSRFNRSETPRDASGIPNVASQRAQD
jgi:hypothetical protein